MNKDLTTANNRYLFWRAFLLDLLFLVITMPLAMGRQETDKKPSAPAVSSPSQQTLIEHDGQHDFDFEIGTWKTQLWRLVDPLTASTKWVEYEGTSIVRKIWNGRANLVELAAEGPAGPFEFLNLRLYSPQTHQWSDGQHDFDFNIGTWTTHVSRLLQPLTGSTSWAEYKGTSVVRKVWNGRASLFELEVAGPGGRIEGMGLRLYNPQSHQWNLNWTTSHNGTLTQPAIGEFKNGRGEFLDHESFNDRAIFARNSFSDVTPNSSRFEQAFSSDGGKTWETNWVMTFTRAKDEADKAH
jgi:hypothetical protein